jgi:hypothetical protein
MPRPLFSNPRPEIEMPKGKPVRYVPPTDAQKEDRLARAIAEAVSARGNATMRDGAQAGLTEQETKKHWDAALVKARKLDPAALAAVQS